MHGVVFTKLKQFVEETFDSDTWSAILKEAGHEDEMFVPIKIYSDETLGQIAAAAVKLSGIARDDLLRAFGSFLAPHLMEMYGALIPADWRTESLLMNVEETIHRVVRMKNPGAEPPKLEFTRLGSGHLQLDYRSERRMSALAHGIMLGIAEHYGEHVDIHETDIPGGVQMLIRIASREAMAG